MMTTGHFLTLFAAAGDWTQVIVPIVVFVIWLINQIANANKGNAPQGPKPQANRPAIPNPRQNRGPLEEVEQFLRDARKATTTTTGPERASPGATATSTASANAETAASAEAAEESGQVAAPQTAVRTTASPSAGLGSRTRRD
jgi:hypothetical protein